MYSHFRNEFIVSLTNNFSTNDITMILSALDTIAYNYEISKKCTDLVVCGDEERRKMVTLYLATKKIAGCSDGTIKLYGGRLKIFLEMVDKKFEEISANDIRMFLVMFKNRGGREEDRFRVLTELIDCKVVPHTIRHTTATLAYENGMNIECIQKLLGHSNISTTQIYAEISDTEVRNAHKKYIV